MKPSVSIRESKAGAIDKKLYLFSERKNYPPKMGKIAALSGKVLQVKVIQQNQVPKSSLML